MRDKRFLRFSWLWALGMAVLFSLLSRGELVLTHDSLFYLDGAKHLLEGKGFYNYFWGYLVPDTHYGPLYPAFIAVISWMTRLAPLQSATVGMMLLILINIRLCASLIQKSSINNGLDYFLLVILPFSTPFWLIHSHSWSEALYLSFFLLAIRLALSNASPWRWYAVGLIAGLSVLVRFSGLFLLPFFGLWLLLEREPIRQKFRRFLIFSLLALLPFLIWTLRNRYVADELSSRQLFWDFAGHYSWLEAADTLLFWLGWSVPLLFGLLLARRSLGHNRLWLLWLVYPAIYVILLVLAKSTIDNQIPLDTRLLSAVFPLFLLLTAALWSEISVKKWQMAIWVFAVLLNLLQFMRPAAQLFKQELDLYPKLVQPFLSRIHELQPPLHSTDTLYCRDFDYNYLMAFSSQPVGYLFTMPQQPFYFAQLTSSLPKEWNSNSWQIDTIIIDRLYYVTPVNHP